MNFTYLLGWTQQDKYYYGCRFAPSATPESLWTTYFTSSERVKEFATIYGSPDLIQIRRIFNSVKEVREWESKVLRRLHIRNNPNRWLNLSENKAIFQTPEIKEKIKSKLKGRIFSPEHKQKLSDAIKRKNLDKEYIEKKRSSLKNYFQSPKGVAEHENRVLRSRRINLGRKHSAESRSNMGTKLGSKQSEQTKAKRKNWYNTPEGVAFRQRQSERAKARKIIN